MKHILMILVVFVLLSVGVVACGGDKEVAADAGMAAAAPAAVAASAEQAVAPVGNAENGKILFATTCAACHGPEGKGVQGLGKDMTTSTFIAGLSDEEMLAFVKTGRPISDPLNTTKVDMPPKGGNPALTEEQLKDIIAFIRTIHVQ